MKTIVVLPTYNEAENLIPLVSAVQKSLPTAQILIVDDNSPDGTGKLADELKQQQPGRIDVLHRSKKEGLGRAYLAAFRIVLDQGADQIIQMDVDFSHPPDHLPQMLQALQSYDFALGSRYVAGGGTKNWGLKRQILSRVGNRYARFVLGLKIRDLTGGFKAFNRPVLEYLLDCSIASHGYNFQIEMTARAIKAGFTCAELPFIFVEREHGVSKMSGDVIWEALLKTFLLRKILKNQETVSRAGPRLRLK